MANNQSTGRGGAGNIGSEPRTAEVTTEASLATPTIKSSTYSTGRGGTGNMAKNDPDRPEIARAAQDVQLPPERTKNNGAKVHHGRGGMANVTSEEDAARPKTQKGANSTTLGAATVREAEVSRTDGVSEVKAEGSAKKERRGSSRVLEKAREWIKGGDS